MSDAFHPTPSVPGLLRRLVLLAGLLGGFLLVGLLFAGPAHADPDDGPSSGGSAGRPVSSVAHSIVRGTAGKAVPHEPAATKPATKQAATKSVARASTPRTVAPVRVARATVPRAKVAVTKAAVTKVAPARVAPRTVVPAPEPVTTTTAAADPIPRHAAALPSRLVAAPPPTAARSVLAPVGALTATVTRTVPAAPELLAPVVAVPRALVGPSGLLDATAGVLVGTVDGLTGTTALTGTLETLGALGRSALGLPGEALGGLVALPGPVDGAAPGAPTEPRPPALAPGVPTLADSPGRGPDPADVGLPPMRSDAVWSTTDAALGLVAGPGAPGAPDPGTPFAPAVPAGTGGAPTSAGGSGPSGVLTDPLTVPAILAALVLLACARRRAWWFPEVAVGPD